MGAGYDDKNTKTMKVKPINFIFKSQLNIKYILV